MMPDTRALVSCNSKQKPGLKYFSFDYRPPRRRTVDSICFPEVDDYIPNKIRQTKKFYELNLLEHLYSWVPRGGVVVDVGANIGNHTAFFSKYLASLVIAIEPHPETFGLLTSTVARNELANVVCVQSAAGSARARVSLSLPKGFERNTGSYRITDAPSTQHPVEVAVDTLDAILSAELGTRQAQVTLIKIDVEGYEQQVLQGACDILRTVKPHLVIEAQSSEELRRLISDLTPLGYRPVGRFCATPTYHFAPWSGSHYLRFRLWKKFAPMLGIKHRGKPLPSIPE